MWSGPQRSVRHRVRRHLRELDAASPPSIEDLCRRLGERRGRPVELWTRRLPPDLSGLTLVTGGRDVIVRQADTTRAHRGFIAAHELAHLMLGHLAEPDADDLPSTVRRGLALDAAPPRRLGSRRRPSPAERDERDAETSAHVLYGLSTHLDARRLVALWRAHRRLAPLWRVLRPAAEAAPSPSAWRVPSPLTRWLRCRDALVVASAYVPPDEGPGGTSREQVAQLRAAMRARASGRPAGSARLLWAVPATGADLEADPEAGPETDLKADLEALCDLADAVRAR